MDRLEKLERGWLFYKLRQLSKAVAVLIVAVAAGGGAVYLALQSMQMLQRPDTQPRMPKEVRAPEPEPKEEPARRERRNEELMKLAPNYDFEQEIDRRIGTKGSQSPQPPFEAQSAAVTRVDSLAALESAFEKQPAYDKAVEIAENHLSRGDSALALKWALRANEINNEDERSWAVFAAASNTLGRKEQAVNALKAYLAAKPSSRLTQLLAQLEQP